MRVNAAGLRISRTDVRATNELKNDIKHIIESIPEIEKEQLPEVKFTHEELSKIMDESLSKYYFGNSPDQVRKKRIIEEANVLIAIPCSWEYMHVAFVKSFFELRKFNWTYGVWGRAQLDTMRNEMVEECLKGDYTHLFMLDADMVYPPDTIVQLLLSDVDIVAGFSARRIPPHIPLFFVDSKAEDSSECEYLCDAGFPAGKPGLYEVKAIGSAGMLIKRKVLESIEPPYFSFSERTPEGKQVGEDVYFCIKARKAGFKVYCRTDLPYVHLVTNGIWYEPALMKPDGNVEWKLQYGTFT